MANPRLASWSLKRTAPVLATWLFLFSSTVARGAPLDGGKLNDALDAVIDNHPTALQTTVSLKVVDLEAGTVLYDRHGERLLTPASNLKIYTSACALDLFRPEHRFQTLLHALGPIESGVLQGDLVLVGGGDAMLTSHDLEALAGRMLKQWKIRKVTGKVRVDNSRYSSPLKGPGWMWDDDPDYYNMPVTPLMLDFNVLSLELKQDPQGLLTAEKKLVANYPKIEVVTPGRLPGKRLFWREPFTDSILLAKRGNLKEYLASLEDDDQPTLTPNDPGRWVASVFQAMLEARGVEFQEQSYRHSDRRFPTHKIEFEGQQLDETLRHFNHVSENAVGEVLLHEIAIARGTKKPKWSDGARAITQWLTEEVGLKPGSFRLVDGSGLSRYNLISADSSVVLLSWMHKHRHFTTFFTALPEYEVELQGIDWPNKPADGFDLHRVRAKSGGMSGVSTISGYLRTLDGRQLAFSLLANGLIGSSKPIVELRQQVWRTLVQYRAEHR